MAFPMGASLRGISWLYREVRQHHFLKLWSTFRGAGATGCWKRARVKFGATPVSPLKRREIAQLLAPCTSKPLISLVVPVFEVGPAWLRRCIRSVRAQRYPNWELLLVEDGGGEGSARRLIERWCRRDPRIRARFLERREGIAGATNAGIAMAKGRFTGFLDDDDTLSPDALAWVVAAHNRCPDAEWFYSDEDKISRWGRCYGAYFKPDFSAEMLLSTMFTCHFSVYGTAIIRRVGGIRPGFEGAQDHDLALRVSESVPSGRVVHIPRVLYHWRTLPGSTALGASQKPTAAEAGRRAVSEALARRNLKGDVTTGVTTQGIYQLSLVPTKHPPVAVLITPGGSPETVRACAEQARKLTGYPNYMILDAAGLSEQSAVGSETQDGRRIRIDAKHAHSKGWQWVNETAEQTDAEFLVLLDPRVRISSDGWMEQLVAVAEMDREIAGVGTLLTYPSGRVDHAGMILGVGGCAGYAHRGLWKSDTGYFGRLHCLQEFSAVTTRFVLLRRTPFLEAGGMGSASMRRTCADVELWNRLAARRGRCLYHPRVEGVYTPDRVRGGRKNRDPLNESQLPCACEPQSVVDPFYNPNLSRENEQFLGFRKPAMSAADVQVGLTPKSVSL